MTQGNSIDKYLSIVVCFADSSGASVQDGFPLFFHAYNRLKLWKIIINRRKIEK